MKRCGGRMQVDDESGSGNSLTKRLFHIPMKKRQLNAHLQMTNLLWLVHLAFRDQQAKHLHRFSILKLLHCNDKRALKTEQK